MATEVHVIRSQALAGNPLGDAAERKLHVIVPEDHDGSPIPCVWYLAGYAGVGRGLLTDDPWQEGLEERLARLRRAGRIGPMLVVLPDAFTKYGGCQYLSSPAVGDYERYLTEELHDFVTDRYPISHHAIAGKSSGGYGAIVHAMRHPDKYDAVACHSGDMGFRLSLIPDLPKLMNAIRDHGDAEKLVTAFDAAVKKKDYRWFGPMSMLALAAVYSPDASAPLGIGLPFDLERGTLDEEMLAKWLQWDPVQMIDVPAYQAALNKMRLVFVDCGDRDEHALHWGARAFTSKLRDLGIAHVHQEFKGGHRGTSHRLDVFMPMLYEALA